MAYEEKYTPISRASAAAFATTRVGLAFNSSNQFALALVGGQVDGILIAAVGSGDETTCYTSGNILVRAGGTATAGGLAMTDANGKFIDRVAGAVAAGRFLTGTTTDGDLVLMEFFTRGQQTNKVRGANTASAAGVVAPPAGADYFHITGALAITGFTNPTGIQDGARLTVIPDGAFTWTTATNIAVAGTAVVSRLLDFQWDATTSKWYPSYV